MIVSPSLLTPFPRHAHVRLASPSTAMGDWIRRTPKRGDTGVVGTWEANLGHTVRFLLGLST
jgi:hypothetical protein